MRQTRLVPLIIVAVLAGLTGCSDDDDPIGNLDTIVGSGVIVEETRNVSGFTRLDHDAVGSLTLTIGAPVELRIEADDNIMPFLSAQVSGGVLRLAHDYDGTLQPSGTVEYYLTVPSIDSIALGGVGDIDAANITADRLEVTLNGVGSIDLPGLDLTELVVTLSGVGDVETGGLVDTQEATISGVGDYDGSDLQSLEADVTITSVGTATVRVSDLLVCSVTGGGVVYYIGDPTVQGNGAQQISG
jgi:hypothetical protein